MPDMISWLSGDVHSDLSSNKTIQPLFFDRKLEIGPTFQNVYIYFLGESPLRLVSKERAEIGVVSTNL